MKNRVLEIDGGINFRDLGGYSTRDGRTVKWHKLYRSGQLNRLTEKGIKTFSSLNITYVFDLRSQGEMDLFPSKTKALQSVQTYEHALHYEPSEKTAAKANMTNWKELMEKSTAEDVRDHITAYYPLKLYSHKGIYKKMLHTLTKENTDPLLFHCAAGKDRTGVGAAILLSLLGVKEEIIIEDYLITQKELSEKVELSMVGGAMTGEQFSDLHNHLGDTSPELLKPLFDADESYIRELFRYIKDSYHDVHTYAANRLDIDQKMVEKLKINLLE